MKKYPIVLTIAGSDSSGGAGIEADIKTISALGAFATAAITAVTAQNTTGVAAIQGIEPEIVGKQIDAVFDDMRPDAVKIGMLHSREIIETVAKRLLFYKPAHVVLDPVMISTSGNRLINENAIIALKQKLFPLASLVTPNKSETEFLSGIDSAENGFVQKSANEIMNIGACAVLIKGGHFSDSSVTDYLYDANGKEWQFPGTYIDTANTHGTGCTLSSAIATRLAFGDSLPDAVKNAKIYLQNALLHGKDVKTGNGHGPLNHFFNPQKLQIQTK